MLSGTLQAFRALRFIALVTLLSMLLIISTNALLIDKDDGGPRPEESEVAMANGAPSLASAQGLLERGAPVAISPGAMPTPAPFVMSHSPSDEEATPSRNVLTFTNSLGCLETITAGTAGVTGGGGSSPEETWIRIAGILVPAIVAIGLGVGGFLVTLHVNRRNEDGGQDDWRN